MAELDFFSSDTKRDLLMLMKRQGTISLDDAEAATGLTRTTLREHLGQLERAGLVERSSRRQGRGRPSLRFNLTSDVNRLFPSRDNVLLGRLLDFLQRHGQEELIRTFFEQFWAEHLKDVRHQLSKLGSDDQKGRLEVLEQLLHEQGFMPDVHQHGEGPVIRECNCPFPEAVKHTRLPCRLEIEFYEQVFNKPVGRVSYIPDGGSACTYEFLEAEAP